MNKGFLKELNQFLGKSALRTYAGDGAEIEPMEKGFHEFEYEEGEWYYKDSYSGHSQSWGRETIWHKNKVIWTQLYGGGMQEGFYHDREFNSKVFSFLKKAMSAGEKVDSFQPRGPKSFTDGSYRYECEWEGGIQKFKGSEKILFEGEVVFTHDFIGGLFRYETSKGD